MAKDGDDISDEIVSKHLTVPNLWELTNKFDAIGEPVYFHGGGGRKPLPREKKQ